MIILKQLRFKLAAVLASTSIFLMAGVQDADATLINFDSVSTEFFIAGVTEGDFSVATSDDGLGTLAAGYEEFYWRGNGTGRLLSWTNSGSTSGFTLENIFGDLFSLESFDFGNGYVSGNNSVSSITLTGMFGGGGTIIETYANTINGWTTQTLSSSWTGLGSVLFRANGHNNRSVWDNINVTVNSVPEPGTLSILAAGLIGFGMLRRRRRAA